MSPPLKPKAVRRPPLAAVVFTHDGKTFRASIRDSPALRSLAESAALAKRGRVVGVGGAFVIECLTPRPAASDG